MKTGEILKDSISYPLNNLRSLAIYIVLSIMAAVAFGGTIIGMAIGTSSNGDILTGLLGVLGFIIFLVIGLLIDGYTLDIVKYGIERTYDAPRIEPARQILNAIKLLILQIVYYLIPIILGLIIGIFMRAWITTIILIILVIIFAFAKLMGQCRLAKTGSLSEGLAILDAISDIGRVGFTNLCVLIIYIAVCAILIGLIGISLGQINTTLGAVVSSILIVYLLFFENRSVGLLYSNI